MSLLQAAGKQPAAPLQPSGTQATSPQQPDALAILEAARLAQKKLEWARWAMEEFTKCKNARSMVERQWYINLAFVNGRQNIAPVTVAQGGFRLSVPPAPPWRVRMVINKIRSAIRTEVAKLSSSRPTPTVVPATAEDEDANAARVAEQILKTAFSGAEFEETYRSWIWWGSVCGTSFLKSYWDPHCIDKEAQLPPEPFIGIDGQPIIGEDGQPLMMQPLPVKGKIKYERVTPFHIYVPDLLCETLDKQPYIIHSTTRDPKWIKRYLNFDAVADSVSSNTILEGAFLTRSHVKAVNDTCQVLEFWIKPNTHRDFPDGGVLTVINNQVVQVQENWPYPFDEYPFYKYSGIPTGGFYADSVIVDLIPLQKEYNRTRSQMVEIKNLLSKPKFFYQKGSINPRQISSEPGQGIPYEVGFNPPTPIPGAEVPVTFHNELDRLVSDFDDISGQHEISRGGTPSQVTSATAIAFLQEQDDTKLNPMVSSIERSIETLGRHYLKYVVQFWENPRLIRIAGKDNAMEAVTWKGRDLKGNTDVRVQTGSALPYSKAALRAQVTEFMERGWFDVATGMELMNLGGFDKVVNELLVDKKQAGRENHRMMQVTEQEVGMAHQPQESTDPQTGEPIQVQPSSVVKINSYDNHQLHIHYHNQFRKTQEYELAPDHVKAEFELHVQTHQQALSLMMVGSTGPVGDPQSAMGQEQEESPADGSGSAPAANPQQ